MTMHGRLTVLCGPMFAGKTEALIERASKLRVSERRVYKPTTDTRQGDGYILSHGGVSITADWIDPDLERIQDTAYILIDEAQFLSAAAVERVLGLVQRGKTVVLAGLDLNASGQPFGKMPDFLCLADEVVKLSGSCSICGCPSARSKCKVDLTGPVLIGGADKYEPRCLPCFSLRC